MSTEQGCRCQRNSCLRFPARPLASQCSPHQPVLSSVRPVPGVLGFCLLVATRYVLCIMCRSQVVQVFTSPQGDLWNRRKCVTWLHPPNGDVLGGGAHTLFFRPWGLYTWNGMWSCVLCLDNTFSPFKTCFHRIHVLLRCPEECPGSSSLVFSPPFTSPVSTYSFELQLNLFLRVSLSPSLDCGSQTQGLCCVYLGHTSCLAVVSHMNKVCVSLKWSSHPAPRWLKTWGGAQNILDWFSDFFRWWDASCT